MNTIINAILNWMIQNNALATTEIALYAYALQSLALMLLPFLLALCIGIYLENIVQVIVMIIPFIILRKFSGGYHAKNFFVCLLCSTAIIFFFAKLALYATCIWKIILITIVLSASLMKFSPICNEDRLLSSAEKKVYKKIVRVLIFIILMVILLLLWSNHKKYAISLSIGIQLTAFLQFPCFLMRIYDLKLHFKLFQTEFHKDNKYTG